MICLFWLVRYALPLYIGVPCCSASAWGYFAPCPLLPVFSFFAALLVRACVWCWVRGLVPPSVVYPSVRWPRREPCARRFPSLLCRSFLYLCGLSGRSSFLFSVGCLCVLFSLRLLTPRCAAWDSLDPWEITY